MSDELIMILDNYNVSKFKARINSSKSETIIQSQKSDHELAPLMLNNQLELKLIILEKSLLYGIYGDIELDQGYSFAY